MWGATGVSKRLRLSNGLANWGTGGQPVAVPIQQSGILAGLRILSNGVPTFTPSTGTIAPDTQGPWNAYTQHVLSPNGTAPIVQLSGYGLYLVNLIKRAERGIGSADTSAIAVTNHAPTTDVYAASAVSGTAPWRFNQVVPITQRLSVAGGDVGYWPLQNPAMQLVYAFTPNSASSGSPYTIDSVTPGQAPYLVTSPATVTLATPTVELVRELWQPPAAAADLPPFNLVSTWIEDAPQGASVNGALSVVWQAPALAGLLARAIVFIFDGSTGNGVASSSLAASNALQLTYDVGTPKFAESAYAALARQHDNYGYELPQGAFVYDLLGPDLTLQDVLDTFAIANIKIQLTLGTALGASNSAVKIVRQMISALQVG